MSATLNRTANPILLYVPDQCSGAGELEAVTRSVAPPRKLWVSRTLDDLRARLLERVPIPEVAILMVPTTEHLDAILSLRDPLLATRVILVLFEDGKDAIAKAHSLRPRFVSTIEGGFLAVAEVLSRLIHGAEGGRSIPDGPRHRFNAREQAACPIGS
ncbi:MAG: hypothetical protein GHCLOJNM_00487 [bacterium]|nr:hypothetical protein [bacterium]